MKIIQRWILARLRHETFTSIAQLNARIRELLRDVVQRPMKITGKSRKELFDSLDKPALKPLPPQPFEYKELKLLKVGVDYHVQLDGVFYSVPYQLAHERVEVWYGSRSVEITHNGKVVATHPKSMHKGGYMTQTAHMASSHKRYGEWSVGRILHWGNTIGQESVELFKAILDNRPHPEMGFRSCMGIMSAYKKQLEKGWSEERLEAISHQARTTNQLRCGAIRALIKERERYQGEEVKQEELIQLCLCTHANIRGGNYYA